jgi:lipoprotein-anchoring transpeptidase ErfK/SrfK
MPPGCRFDGAKMTHFMRIVGGIGMHEGFLPGYPASHGCIRMPARMAEIFFHNVSIGTPCTIRP